MKQLLQVLIVLALLATSITAMASDWGYPQERMVKRTVREAQRNLRLFNQPSYFRFYEDGSWVLTGCIRGGLCEDGYKGTPFTPDGVP